MLTHVEQSIVESEIRQITDVPAAFPVEKVVEVRDYVLVLQARYAQSGPVEVSDVWSEQDMHDLTAAALSYAEQLL